MDNRYKIYNAIPYIYGYIYTKYKSLNISKDELYE